MRVEVEGSGCRVQEEEEGAGFRAHLEPSSSSLLLSSLELSDTKDYELQIRALLGTAAPFYKVVVLKLGSGLTFKLPWREAGPPNHHDDTVDSDQ